MQLDRKAFTMDTYRTGCRCGGSMSLLRRGRLALIPAGHRRPDGGPCPALEAQDNLMRTHRALCSIDQGYTEAELARELREAHRG